MKYMTLSKGRPLPRGRVGGLRVRKVGVGLGLVSWGGKISGARKVGVGLELVGLGWRDTIG